MSSIGTRARVASLAWLAATMTLAETPPKTFVSLAGSADDHPRLGNPIVRVEVLADSPALVDGLSGSLVADLTRLVHARPEIGDTSFDYRLRVRLVPPPAGGGPEPFRFEASLEAPDRVVVWQSDGRADASVDGDVSDVLSRISRNLVSALVHDRWVVPKDDPDDPPPPAPNVLKSFP